jgi:hypothetical protein
MQENNDQLSETFAAHEYLAPNPVEVLEKANLRARAYRRRRRAAQATGISVLGAGVVAGGVTLPTFTWHQQRSDGGSTVSQALSGASAPISLPTPTPTPPVTPSPIPLASPPSYNQQQKLDEYFADGYDYNNAVALASLWNESDITSVKAAAGLKLLDGASLPVTPDGTPETAQQKALDAYFAAGYDYNNAITLGTLWHETDLQQIKTEAGQMLMDGKTLPVAPTASTAGTLASATPSPDPAISSADAQALAAYFADGYDYDNAIALGTLWHETDLQQIKTEAGQKLLAGQTLPVKPTNGMPSATSSPTPSSS